MKRKRRLAIAGALAVAAVLVAGVVAACGGDDDGPMPSADLPTGVIEGTVTSNGSDPEAGVWVIAETDDLSTPFRKIVVTDDDGRFVLPELPDASYDVWVRGYGLRDSDRTEAELGATVALDTEIATPQEAARNYPSNYFLAMYEPHDPSADWMHNFKMSCMLCHQFGSIATRAGSTREFYERGLRKATQMWNRVEPFGGDEFIDSLVAWGRSIQEGAIPPEAPPRPEGTERNLVITQWNWGDGFAYSHDEIATDKRDPTLNAWGKVWGVDLGNDRLLSVDPITHEVDAIPVPTRDGFDTPWCSQTYMGPARAEEGSEEQPVPSGFGTLGCPTEDGETPFEGAYDNPANPHNPMMDEQGRVWMTTQIRREWAEDYPEWCQDDPVIMENTHHRQLAYYDPARDHFELIDTCFSTHHLQFDEDGVLWFSNDQVVIGWFDPSKYEEGNPASAGEAQGWSARMVDTDGDGEADSLAAGSYGVIPSPDGTVWTSTGSGGTEQIQERRATGHIARYDPETDTHESYVPPAPGSGPRGLDVDTNGIIWAGLAGSGHLGRFDRSQCAQTWGDGEQCPEGWTLYETPGPKHAGSTDRGADFHYYTWVDQHNTFGMGENTVFINGTDSDSLIAFDQETEEFTVIRIPYPLNTFTRGLDGRIDNPEMGWKGRGLWFTNGLDPVLHSELPTTYVGKVQMRPDPLAR